MTALRSQHGLHLACYLAAGIRRPCNVSILHGECALGVLKDLFGFPGRSVCIGGRGPAQGVHPSAVEALGVPNANLPGGWSLSTTPSPKPHVPQSVDV